MPVLENVNTEVAFERLLARVLRKAGWKVLRQSAVERIRPDLVIESGEKTYVIELKKASEARPDRLIPLLSQAILEAKTTARLFPRPAVPLAVIAASRIAPSIAEQLKQFAAKHAPDVAVGIIDAEGLRSFSGPGLEGINAEPARRPNFQIAAKPRLPDLFSDLNQWMLKILLGQHLPESLIQVPRDTIRTASRLAGLAGVSIMSATRLVNHLADRGFLDEDRQQLQLVRIDELLDLWASNHRGGAEEIPAHWIVKGGPHQLNATLAQYASRKIHNQPRCCLGLFAAADALGLGFVHGVAPHIYLERMTLDALSRLGLVVGESNRPAGVYIRIPARRVSIFRASVTRDGIPVTDVLQVWLDASTHPARGREQAREIYKRVFKPLFLKQR